MKNQELVFPANRLKAALLLLGSVAFVAIGWWMKEQRPLIAWLGIVFFGTCAVAGLIMLLPGAVSLRLDHEGFETNTIGRKFKTRWEDVETFKVESIRSGKLIAIHYRAGFTGQKTARALAHSTCGIEGAIPNHYNISLLDLERTLNQWLERFGRVGIH